MWQRVTRLVPLFLLLFPRQGGESVTLALWLSWQGGGLCECMWRAGDPGSRVGSVSLCLSLSLLSNMRSVSMAFGVRLGYLLSNLDFIFRGVG